MTLQVTLKAANLEVQKIASEVRAQVLNNFAGWWQSGRPSEPLPAPSFREAFELIEYPSALLVPFCAFNLSDTALLKNTTLSLCDRVVAELWKAEESEVESWQKLRRSVKEGDAKGLHQAGIELAGRMAAAAMGEHKPGTPEHVMAHVIVLGTALVRGLMVEQFGGNVMLQVGPMLQELEESSRCLAGEGPTRGKAPELCRLIREVMPLWMFGMVQE